MDIGPTIGQRRLQTNGHLCFSTKEKHKTKWPGFLSGGLNMHVKLLKRCSFAIAILLCLSGCSSNNSSSHPTEESPVATLEASAETTTNSENASKGICIDIPERYEETSGRVSFHCEIEVPEGFDTGSLHKARVERVYSSDADKALEAFAKEKTIAEHHVSPAEGDIPQEDSYIFSDGSILSTGNGSSFVTKNSQHYSGAFWRLSQEGEEDSQEKFDFAEPDECEGKIGKVLQEIGYGAELEFESFSLNAETAKVWEEHLAQDGGYSEEEYKKDWSSEDNAYVFYAFQSFQGLPVFHELMFLGGNMKFVNADNAPVQVIYTPRGIEFLQISYLYQLEEEEEIISLRPFEEAARTVEEKINSILSDTEYEVKYAKLMQMVKHDRAQEYEVLPVWYFEADSQEGTMVVLVDAATAEEVFLK